MRGQGLALGAKVWSQISNCRNSKTVRDNPINMALFSCKIGYELSIGIGFEAFEAVYCFGPRWQFDSSNATICMMRHYSNIRVQGSRTCTSAVPPTNISRQQIPSTNSVNCDEATFQVARIVMLLQIPCIVTILT